MGRIAFLPLNVPLFRSFRQNRSEWLLGGFMVLLCGVLTLLQYRWTGEVAQAELTRLRGNLDEQARAVTRAWDAELSSACDQLVPQRSDFADQSLEEAHGARYREWVASHPRPMFRRIALAVAADNEVRLLLLDPVSVQFVPAPWPEDWGALRESLRRKSSGGPPPSSDDRGTLLEFPVFGGSRESRGEHWMILELDRDYLRDRWFPDLVSEHLNPGSLAVNEARVTAGTTKPEALFSATASKPGPGEPRVSVRFNQLGRTGNSRVPLRGGGRWQLDAWQHRGALEAAVAASQRRNFAVAAGLGLLMLVTGISLIQYTRRSRRLSEQQMEFVATVSHELRTPLTVIRGAGHNLLRGIARDPARVTEYAQLIVRHSEQLTEMVEQTLALAGAGRVPGGPGLAGARVNLSEVLAEAVSATAEETRGAGCAVQVEIPGSLPAVEGDAAALRRVFQNLISNAAKHGGAGGWIGIAARGQDQRGFPGVQVDVSDRGPGIPESERSEIFKAFFRGTAARQAQIRGSGLGLSLVQQLVRSHGGDVSLSGPSGPGATFRVWLPAAKAPSPEARRPSNPEAEHPQAGP